MSKKELLELLKKSLQDALDSIQGRDKQELNEEKRTELKKEIEKVFENEQAENNKEENEKIDGKNVFGVMMLGAGKGEKLRLRAISENGGNPEEEIKLLEELRQLIEINKFFE